WRGFRGFQPSSPLPAPWITTRSHVMHLHCKSMSLTPEYSHDNPRFARRGCSRFQHDVPDGRISFLDAIHFLLQRTQRAVDDTHVISDMHTLAIVLRIVTRQVHSDVLPVVGDLELAHATGQRLARLWRWHRLRK